MAASRVPLDNFATCGPLLKFLRRRARLSQRELSIAVGYSESQISRLENDERTLDRTSALALFVPALHLHDEPEIVARLLALTEMQHPTPAQAAAVAVPSTAPAANGTHHLPVPLTTFIGRAEEAAEICALLGDPDIRLLTLTGAGGCGKTRLALHAGRHLAEDYPAGAWWAELAALTEPQRLAEHLAAALGVKEDADDALLALLADRLGPGRALLLLDNCEHLVEEVAALVVALLNAAPQLQILATSREALGVPGEWNYRVQPLALPPARRGELPQAATVAPFDAIRLFVVRAQAARPAFTLNDQNAAAVLHICHRLDGMPLGIELAAAWTHLLAPAQIAERLEQDFSLLVTAGRTVLPRHQTLAAAIDWSYRLLTPAERLLLRQLSVFAGGWGLAGAEAVAEGLAGQMLLYRLNRLADKSLIVVDHAVEGTPRYRLLEPIREYLAAKLAAEGEGPATRRRHLAYCLALAEQLEPQTRGSGQGLALATLDREQENLRAALEWGLAAAEAGDAAGLVAAELAYRLGRYWYVRQQWREGRAWVGRALAAMELWRRGGAATACPQDETATRYARLLFRAGYLAAGQGELPVAETYLAQSLAQHRALGNRRELARCLQELSTVASEQGAYADAAEYLEESLACIRPLGDDWLLATSLAKLADVAGEQGDYARCQALAAEHLSLARQLGDTGQMLIGLNLLAQCAIAGRRYREAVTLLEEALAVHRHRHPGHGGGPWTLRNLGLAWQLLGDYGQAAACYAQSLRLRWEQEQPGGMAWALEGLGEVCALAGAREDAARCWGAASRLRRSVGSHAAPSDEARQAPLAAQVRTMLGARAYTAAWTEGERLPPTEIVKFVDDLVLQVSAHEPA